MITKKTPALNPVAVGSRLRDPPGQTTLSGASGGQRKSNRKDRSNTAPDSTKRRSVDARERLLAHGAGSLSDVELLALVLGTGSRDQPVLALAAGLRDRVGSLAKIRAMDVRRLSLEKGIGPAKAARLLGALELGVRAMGMHENNAPSLCSSQEVDRHMRAKLAHLSQECLYVIALDSRFRPTRELCLATGSHNSCSISPAEVFHAILGEQACAMILVHNHPSGDPRPSPEDRTFTERMAEAGTLLGIPLLDHVVIGLEGYFSFADEGILPMNPD